jgi:hypothetical protein
MAVAKIDTEFPGPERVAEALGVSRTRTQRLIREAREYLRRSAGEMQSSTLEPAAKKPKRKRV